VVLIYIGPHPGGCVFFDRDGSYTRGTAQVDVFRAGDVYWRDGTRSVRISQQGLEAVIERRIADAKAAWLDEQREIRRRERDELESAYAGRRLTEGPLGTVGLDLATGELTIAALELLRRGDTIALLHLLNDAVARAGALIEHDEIEGGLADVLDKLACLAATFLEYEQHEWFGRVVRTLTQVYSLPVGDQEAARFGYSSSISPQEVAPRVWLEVTERVSPLGRSRLGATTGPQFVRSRCSIQIGSMTTTPTGSAMH
jgi:hypothetical protein